jgi:hypothetical protein
MAMRDMTDNSVWAQWHRMSLSHEQITRMDPMKQSLFRGVRACVQPSSCLQ